MAGQYKSIPSDPTSGYYEIVSNREGQHRWVWREGGQTEDTGTWVDDLPAALREAAQDWDDNGEGGRLSATLRIAARRAETTGATVAPTPPTVEDVRDLLRSAAYGEADGSTIPVPVEDIRLIIATLDQLLPA
ncbi:hypothetical protein [Microbacterium sp. 77mftsu3.1]|uniref:hypothetical protein n=1 Tax=Microbacterium sp. 77mftsu3.1 TaxID=1761802 RepID=UPI00035EE860|nr:hypothetical protein [Microbacterium sp. 77mftsu3.1]SDH38330.1 hypothetical protein SAMN04488590_3192 [Microbacterium sp. 77mftsu3.1]